MPLPIQTIRICSQIRFLRMRLFPTRTIPPAFTKILRSSGEKFQYLSTILSTKINLYCRCFSAFLSRLHKLLIYPTHPYWIQLCYFVSTSFLGFLSLKCLGSKKNHEDLDLFFMSTSAATVSSMSTVEMEVFSTSQLLVLALLMLFGGEVFTSLLGLQLLKSKRKRINALGLNTPATCQQTTNTNTQIELVLVESPDEPHFHSPTFDRAEVKVNSPIRVLSCVIMGYLLLAHIAASVTIFAYLSLAHDARNVIQNKGVDVVSFSLFMTISSFANGGFAPINENMAAFRNNPAILSLMIPLILMGNTLFPPCLRLSISILKRITKREEFDQILDSARDIGFHHLLTTWHSVLLLLTVVGIILLQTIFFCFLEWNSQALNGLNPCQKVVGALFQSVNARHAGESIFDLSILSPAILVSYIIMMYLPPYTTFIPVEDERCTSTSDIEEKKSMGVLSNLIMSQLSYLAIFVILICITERRKISEDPLNFNVLNIVLEVISAYGNVGFSTGYSCKRRLKPDGDCTDAWYGFVGKWSSQGKLILIFVMFFGRLKKFNMNGGKAWKLQ